MTEVTKEVCCENGQTVIKIIVNNYCKCCCKGEEPEKPKPTCPPIPTCSPIPPVTTPIPTTPMVSPTPTPYPSQTITVTFW
ncbi:hypothetical protein GCM10009131_04520 [Morganella psychrotolerans]